MIADMGATGSAAAGDPSGRSAAPRRAPVLPGTVLAVVALVLVAAVLTAVELLSGQGAGPGRSTAATGAGPPASAWSVSYPTSTAAGSTPWRPGPDPNGPDPDGDGLDARGCPYPNPYPDVVSDRDHDDAAADPDPLVLRCSVDRR